MRSFSFFFSLNNQFITQASVVIRDLKWGESSKSLYWLEERSSEGGRHVVCRYVPDGNGNTANAALTSVRSAIDVTPSDSNARTRVHEYGGGSFLISTDPSDNKEVLIYSNFADQVRIE
jgi:hypothetical protein